MEIFLPGYRVLDKIGEGGMGVVFQARDLQTGRLVALKILRRSLHQDPETKGRFLREAILVSTLDHPNVCRLLQSGDAPSGEVFIAMEYCPGKTLEEWLRRELPPLEWTLDVAVQASRGLSAAHERGIVHRDIKPSNLAVGSAGEVKILDFGLARFLAAKPIRQEAAFLGSLHYAAPEQLAGGEIDHRADLWSLGVVLYEMATGYLPFRGDRRQAIEAIQRSEPEPLRHLRPEAPTQLEEIVLRSLQKQPRLRYPSAEALCADLEHLAEALGRRAVPARLPRFTSRQPTQRGLLDRWWRRFRS